MPFDQHANFGWGNRTKNRLGVFRMKIVQFSWIKSLNRCFLSFSTVLLKWFWYKHKNYYHFLHPFLCSKLVRMHSGQITICKVDWSFFLFEKFWNSCFWVSSSEFWHDTYNEHVPNCYVLFVAVGFVWTASFILVSNYFPQRKVQFFFEIDDTHVFPFHNPIKK